MRLAMCALSAVLLSGCSWLGSGGHYNDSYGYQYGNGGAYGSAGCVPTAQGSWVQSGSGVACAPGQGYGVASNGYMATGYNAYGAGMGGAQGMNMAGYGGGMTGATGYGGSATTLTAAAPYGAAVGGGGMAMAGGNVQTVQGAPIYVNQPYAAPYGVPVLRGYSQGGGAAYGCCGGLGGGAAMPLGFEAFAGTEFNIGGDIFNGKDPGPNNEDLTLATAEVVSPSISYDTAFDEGYHIGGGFGYDVSRNTTLLGTVAYQRNNGKSFENGTFQPGTYDALGNFTSTGPAEVVTAEMSDLEQITLEGGVRQYVGNNPGLRPYVGASAGFTHNNDVDLTQSSTSLTTFSQPYVDAGWRPTAAGVIGAEMAVGPRAALGVETGVRWRDNLDTVGSSDDRWSIPVSLRGRIAF